MATAYPQLLPGEGSGIMGGPEVVFKWQRASALLAVPRCIEFIGRTGFATGDHIHRTSEEIFLSP